MKTMFVVTVGCLLALGATRFAAARGFGGAHGGGGGGAHGGAEAGGFHGASGGGREGSGGGREGGRGESPEAGRTTGSASGFHASGAEAGGFHASGAEAGGFHASGAEAGGFHASGAEAGAFHAGGVEATGYHAALPTDAGFGAAGAASAAGTARAGTAAAASHATQPLNNNVAAARGAAVRNSYSGAGTFDKNWYGAHPGAWNATGWAAGAAWHPAAWAGVGTTLGWAASVQPIAYNYGSNITYQGDQVYYGDQSVGTADQYYQQAATIAQAAPPTADNSPDWTPLGVFALVQKEQDEPHYVIQFAVNKSGAIGGNYSDLLSDTITPIHGSVDQKTQRVAWIVGNNKKNVGETGLANLTKAEAPALIHQGSDKTTQWLLVRLQQPDQAKP